MEHQKGFFPEGTIESWKKDVLFMLDEVAEGPQKRKEIEDQGVWTIPTKSTDEGVYTFSMNLLKEAENHRLLNGPIPITCPVRLIHGMRDEDVPWHVSMQVAERVLSNDVEIILRRHGQHHMSNEDDMRLMMITVHGLVEKLIYNA